MGSLPPGFTKSARRWGVLLLAVWLLALLPARPLLAQDATYTVVAGDTLAAIAERLGVPLDALVAANQIENPALIQVGQVLVIPGADGTVPAAAIPAVTVPAQPGDTPVRVATRLGVDPRRSRRSTKPAWMHASSRASRCACRPRPHRHRSTSAPSRTRASPRQ
ncbi:MAG: LysM peptidoglycan-binding domain-containing protein [Caldilineaceae bacterium]